MMIQPCIFSDEVSPDFEDAVRLSAEAGAAGLELRGRLFGRTITQVDAADVARIQEICRRYGVRVAVIGSPIGKCSMEDPDECRRHQAGFARMVELAGVFETPLIRGFALWRPGRSRDSDHVRPDLEAHLDRITAFLEPVVRAAEAAGVRYCLETEGATMVGTCAEAASVMNALGDPPALGLAWDVNNGLACGEHPLPAGYSRVRGRVFHVHVKPNSAGSLGTVGDSSLTYRRVLEVLRDDGYRGWASIEHWGGSQQMLQGLRELVPLLRSLDQS